MSIAEDSTVRALQETVETNPRDRDAYWNLGLRLKKANDFTAALQVFEKLLGLSTGTEKNRAYREIACIHERLGDDRTVVEVLQKALELDAEDRDAQEIIGRAYRRLDDFDSALRAFEKAIELRQRRRPSADPDDGLFFMRSEMAACIWKKEIGRERAGDCGALCGTTATIPRSIFARAGSSRI